MIYVLIRESPDYPYAPLMAGFTAARVPAQNGYPFSNKTGAKDWLFTWTLWSHTVRFKGAQHIKARGGRLIVCENGLLPIINGTRYWQICYDFHNGGGSHRIGGPERWRSWGQEIRPWRQSGEYILICAQRGTRPNDPLITHGPDWTENICRRIREITDRPIKLRPHPGNNRPCLPTSRVTNFEVLDPREPYSQHLAKAHVVVVYTSTAANQALLEGVPVIYDGPAIAMKEAACSDLRRIEDPFMPDREVSFERAAWAQWSAAEIASGETWRWISGT